MTSISDIRDMLPDMDGYAYFQTSGFSPKPIPVIDEIIHWLRFQSRGPALPFVGDKIQKVFEKTRSRVAGALNASPEEIVPGELFEEVVELRVGPELPLEGLVQR